MLELHTSGSYIDQTDPGEPSTGNPRLSVTDLEAAILTVLADGQDVLEIGTGLGVSTRALASSARIVHTIDIDEWVIAEVWPRLPMNVRRWRDAAEISTVPVVAFIDGDHSTEAVVRDLEIADKAGARLIIVHDTNSPTVKAALGDGWRFIPTTHGLGVKRIQ